MKIPDFATIVAKKKAKYSLEMDAEKKMLEKKNHVEDMKDKIDVAGLSHIDNELSDQVHLLRDKMAKSEQSVSSKASSGSSSLFWDDYFKKNNNNVSQLFRTLIYPKLVWDGLFFSSGGPNGEYSNK